MSKPAPLPSRYRHSEEPEVDEAPQQPEEESMFEQIVKEIDDRNVFLQQMADLGKSNIKLEGTIKGEIAERVRELKKLDALIRERRAAK